MENLSKVSPTVAHSWFLVQVLPILESHVPVRKQALISISSKPNLLLLNFNFVLQLQLRTSTSTSTSTPTSTPTPTSTLTTPAATNTTTGAITVIITTFFPT